MEIARVMDAERARLDDRRQKMGLQGIAEQTTANGLAISGGGIRSATLGFGIMQALASVSPPQDLTGHASPAQRPTAIEDPPSPPPKGIAGSLLSRFDYLSTVSGGGYIGAFFCSLFVPNRLKPSDTRSAAQDAYRILATVPPGRLRSTDNLGNTELGKCPTGWLRENGRYLTPTGAGDYLYALATVLRNWLAIQYVLGTLFLVVFSLLALVRALLVKHWLWYQPNVEMPLMQLPGWPSPILILAGAVILLWLAPSGFAFWLAYPRPNQGDQVRPQVFGAPVIATLLVLVIMAAAMLDLFWLEPTRLTHPFPALVAMAVPTLVAAIGTLVHLICSPRVESLSQLRVVLTRMGAHGIAWTLGIGIVGLADTLGQFLYWQATRAISIPAALVTVIVWLVRRSATLLDGRKTASRGISRIPWTLLAAMAGVALVLLIGSLWDVFIQWTSWQSQTPVIALFASPDRVATLAVLLAVSMALAATSGYFSGFINLSTLQSIYGTRLTRAYLGATNGRRFAEDAPVSARSAAEPLPDDQLDLETYYSNDSLAPTHIINVTLNQTIDPAEQLVQRDRKGKPLAILPRYFSVDGDCFPFDPNEAATRRTLWKGSRAEPMTVGQWIGTSGAAVSTGLGRSTSFGTSLLLGLSNVRLGTWWSSGQGVDAARGLEKAFKASFKTHTFLLYELFARFYGLHREWQYLSDGGHFENTAIYELLRPERKLQLIVACDNGCDPGYQFQDLANLVRLARIDFNLDVEVDTEIASHETLGTVFGVPADFDGKSIVKDKCALLLRASQSSAPGPRTKPCTYILLLKPRIIQSSSIDITEYWKAYPAFPQQSTAEQFFDEAQWESYRDLGYRMGIKVFGSPAQGGVGAALWEYLKLPDRGLGDPIPDAWPETPSSHHT
jgi:hypothetical protein